MKKYIYSFLSPHFPTPPDSNLALLQVGGGGGAVPQYFSSERKKVVGPEEVESQTRLSSALQAKLNVLGQAASLWGGRGGRNVLPD